MFKRKVFHSGVMNLKALTIFWHQAVLLHTTSYSSHLVVTRIYRFLPKLQIDLLFEDSTRRSKADNSFVLLLFHTKTLN